MHVLARCRGSCVWVVFVPGPGTHWGGSQHRLGPYSVVAVVAVATSAAALGALTLGHLEPDLENSFGTKTNCSTWMFQISLFLSPGTSYFLPRIMLLDGLE